MSRVESYQPQQSVLKPQAGQRHTACMRYISEPQRSHSILSPLVDEAEVVKTVVFSGVIGRAGGLGDGGCGMRGIIACATRPAYTCTRESARMMASQNTGTSSGLRDVTRLPSSTTGLST